MLGIGRDSSLLIAKEATKTLTQGLVTFVGGICGGRSILVRGWIRRIG